LEIVSHPRFDVCAEAVVPELVQRNWFQALDVFLSRRASMRKDDSDYSDGPLWQAVFIRDVSLQTAYVLATSAQKGRVVIKHGYETAQGWVNMMNAARMAGNLTLQQDLCDARVKNIKKRAFLLHVQDLQLLLSVEPRVEHVLAGAVRRGVSLERIRLEAPRAWYNVASEQIQDVEGTVSVLCDYTEWTAEDMAAAMDHAAGPGGAEFVQALQVANRWSPLRRLWVGAFIRGTFGGGGGGGGTDRAAKMIRTASE
jgi:hypothetical protein